MTVRIFSDFTSSEKLLTQATNQAIGILEQGEALFATIDKRFTAHIDNVFRSRGAGGKRWARITGFTKQARQNATDGTAPHLYYAREKRRLRGEFGWTGRMRKQALEPGKVTKKTLVRDFGGERNIERKKLEWFHFGARIPVTRKSRRFLASQGLPLAKSTKTLVREPRPIYSEKELGDIVNKTTETFLELVFAGGEVHKVENPDA